MTLTTAANAIWLQSTAPGGFFWWAWSCCPPAICAANACRWSSAVWEWRSSWRSQPPVRIGFRIGLCRHRDCLRALCGHDGVVGRGPSDHCGPRRLMWSTSGPAPGSCPVLAAFGLFQMAPPYVFFARGLRSISSKKRPASACGSCVAALVGLHRLVPSPRPGPSSASRLNRQPTSATKKVSEPFSGKCEKRFLTPFSGRATRLLR